MDSLKVAQNLSKVFTRLGIASTLAATVIVSLSSHAGVGTSLMQTAPVLEPGKYEAKAQADIAFNQGGGFNISPHFQLGLIDHYLDLDAWVATGTTDFQIGSMAKYNILPDIEGQVGLSILFEVAFVRDENINSFLTGFGFLTSKKMTASFGSYSPYAAFQVETLINKNNSRAPLTLLAGSKIELKDTKWTFYGELGVSLHQSLTSFAIGAGYPF